MLARDGSRVKVRSANKTAQNVLIDFLATTFGYLSADPRLISVIKEGRFAPIRTSSPERTLSEGGKGHTREAVRYSRGLQERQSQRSRLKCFEFPR